MRNKQVCETPQELIKSSDFMRWLDIVLNQTKIFNKEYILSLFEKLQKDEVLNDEEKENLLKFVQDDKVEEFWKELLSKLSNVSINVKTNNLNELWSFTELLNTIFSQDWYKKIQSYIWKVAWLVVNKLEQKEEINNDLWLKWKPTHRDIEIMTEIKERDPENFTKLVEVLEYADDYIQITLPKSWVLKIDRIYYKWMSWSDAMGYAKLKWQRLLSYEELSELIKFYWVLNTTNIFPIYKISWSNTKDDYNNNDNDNVIAFINPLDITGSLTLISYDKNSIIPFILAF